jgi:hypothetical protein
MQLPIGRDQQSIDALRQGQIGTVVGRMLQLLRQGRRVGQQTGAVVHLRWHLQQPAHPKPHGGGIDLAPLLLPPQDVADLGEPQVRHDQPIVEQGFGER